MSKKRMIFVNPIRSLKLVKSQVANLLDQYEGKDDYLFSELWDIYNRLALIIEKLEGDERHE